MNKSIANLKMRGCGARMWPMQNLKPAAPPLLEKQDELIEIVLVARADGQEGQWSMIGQKGVNSAMT